MDESEKLANEYLASLGFKNVIFEPDGNVPPDFLANGRIAFEVRRLNQNELSETGFRGLEEIAIPLQMTIRKLLLSMGHQAEGAAGSSPTRSSARFPFWINCSLS